MTRVAIRMPKVSYEADVASLSGWLKAVGDRVAVDEPIAEVETEKTNLDLAAPATGVLSEIIVGPHEDVAVDSVIGYVDVED